MICRYFSDSTAKNHVCHQLNWIPIGILQTGPRLHLAGFNIKWVKYTWFKIVPML